MSRAQREESLLEPAAPKQGFPSQDITHLNSCFQKIFSPFDGTLGIFCFTELQCLVKKVQRLMYQLFLEWHLMAL